MWKYVVIGKVLKPYRKAGEMLVVVKEPYIADIEKCQAVFLKIDGLPVPFFMEYSDLDVESGILKVEELNAPEEVRPFNGQDILLRDSDVSVIMDPDIDFGAFDGLEGFLLKDLTSGQSFEILKVQQYPQQLMAIVEHEGKECLIPLVEEFIHSVDADHRIISLTLPEGLIE